MNEILRGVKAGDLVEFYLITNPVEIVEIEHSCERCVTLLFKCHSGYWGLCYKWDGTQLDSNCFIESGIYDAFDIVRVTRQNFDNNPIHEMVN
ncbi:hypothetical protein [Acinetobacter sp.]|uniref:hypothetical protein n=1 Tax=Acinetobacter sp. TaxID=472 RepID=UPI002588A3D1|nr:hypothetical protein [Acinetobacter sp.]